MWFSFLLLAAALSIDALGISAAYVMKGVHIPARSKLVIGFLSAVILWTASLIGKPLAKVLPAGSLKYAGIIILAGMGLLYIINSIKNSSKTYDLDESKNIEGFEVLLLAVSISIDSAGVGITAAALGYSWVMLGFAVGFTAVLFLWAGEWIAEHSRLGRTSGRTSGVLSGCILILIGIIRLFTS